MKKEKVYKFLEQYGNNFMAMRKNANLSQLEVARSIGCSQAIISHIERGHMLPRPKIEKAMIKLYKKATPECCETCTYYNEDRKDPPCCSCTGFSNWEFDAEPFEG